jgi:hypothetical protein
MKTFSRILSEVAQPNSEDELNFKQKHIIDPIDHTVAPESTFSGAVDKDDIDGMKRYRKNKRLADYQRPDDEDVYEAVTLKRDLSGQEDSDVDNDDDSDMTDAQYKYRKHAQIKMHKIDETVYVIPEEILATEKNAFHTAAANAHATGKKHFAFAGKKYPVTMSKDAAKTFAGKGDMSEAMDPVGKEDDDINNDDKVNKSDKYLHARRKAISASIRTKIKEGFGAVAAAGGDYDEEPSHQRYKKSNTTKKEDAALGDGKGSKIYAGKTRESQIDEVQIKKPTKSEREIAYADGSSNSSANMKVNRLAYALDKEPKKKVSLPKTPWNEELEEAMSLDKVNKVHAESGAEGFAKDYVKGNKGDYISGGPTEKHEKDSEKFHTTYKRVGGKSGFGGSGHDIYQHNTTGEKFRIDRTPNGKGFHGTDHAVSKINEEVELDEVSKKTLGSYIKKASHDVATNSAATARYSERANKALDKMKTGDYSGDGQRRKDTAVADKAFNKSWKRRQGIAMAADKLTKEEVELDELKKSTLASYVTKAAYDTAAHAARFGADQKTKKGGSSFVKAHQRLSGIKKASDKLAKEEVELDEVSKALLGRYIKKAKTDVAGKAYQLGAKDPLKPQASWSKTLGREKRIDKAVDRLTKEEVELDEAFNAGLLKLNDGSSISVNSQDAKLLNQLINGLRQENAKKMMKVAMTDKDGFKEILGFAREAL